MYQALSCNCEAGWGPGNKANLDYNKIIGAANPQIIAGMIWPVKIQEIMRATKECPNSCIPSVVRLAALPNSFTQLPLRPSYTNS